jgi:site-specific recombinase XerD
VPTATSFPALIRAFELALTVEGLRPRTISNYTRDVRRFLVSLGDRSPRSITSSDVRAWLAAFQPR